MNKIKVLWIDDEHEEYEDFKIDADINGIKFECIKSYEEFKNMGDEILKYNAIVLDFLFFNKKDQVAGTEQDGREKVKPIEFSLNHITTNEKYKNIPWFVYTRQEGVTNETNLLEANNKKYYIKVNDQEQLFNDIKTSVNNQPEYQLKNKIDALNESAEFKNLLKNEYLELLKVCYDDVLGKASFEVEDNTIFQKLVHFIKQMGNHKIEPVNQNFNDIRKIIEKLFDKLFELEIVPKEFIAEPSEIIPEKFKDKPNNIPIEYKAKPHTKAMNLLIGPTKYNSTKYPHNMFEFDNDFRNKYHIKLIFNNISKLFDILQDESHAKNDLIYNVDSYKNNAKSDYLYRSCIYLLFDILYWFQDFIAKDVKNKWMIRNSYNDSFKYINEIFEGEIVEIKPDKNGNVIGLFTSHKNEKFPNILPKILVPPNIVKNYDLKTCQTIKCKLINQYKILQVAEIILENNVIKQ